MVLNLRANLPRLEQEKNQERGRRCVVVEHHCREGARAWEGVCKEWATERCVVSANGNGSLNFFFLP